MRILVTSGATREPIDGVRFLTNFSTGRTGARLADLFRRAGHEVTLLSGEGAARPESDCRRLTFGSFEDLNERLKLLLSEEGFHAVFHLAAVSDYSVESVVLKTGDSETRIPAGLIPKLDSNAALSLDLKRNFKIVERLRDYASLAPRARPLFLVAFKLTHRASPEERLSAARRLSMSSACDLVIHNDLSEIRSPEEHPFNLFKSGSFRERAGSVDELGALLVSELRQWQQRPSLQENQP